MNTHSAAIPDSSLPSAQAASPLNTIRPLYWSVRRELWENRFLYIAPLVVAVIIVFAFLLSTFAGIWERVLRLNPTLPPDKITEPFEFAALLIMGTTFLVGIFYCLEALHGERRDRSILFWKSLPVSDVTAVLSKACIPVIVLPLITFVITVATHWIMFMVGSAVTMASGHSLTTLWSHLPLFDMWLVLFLHLLAIHGFLYAPIWGWLLLASSWAKRAVFICAVLPWIAIGIIERIAFHSSYFVSLLGSIVGGGSDGSASGSGSGLGAMNHLMPRHFFSSPGLWIGLAFTAACLAAAVQIRRNRGPI